MTPNSDNWTLITQNLSIEELKKIVSTKDLKTYAGFARRAIGLTVFCHNNTNDNKYEMLSKCKIKEKGSRGVGTLIYPDNKELSIYVTKDDVKNFTIHTSYKGETVTALLTTLAPDRQILQDTLGAELMLSSF